MVVVNGDASHDNFDEDDNLAEHSCHIYSLLINDNRALGARLVAVPLDS